MHRHTHTEFLFSFSEKKIGQRCINYLSSLEACARIHYMIIHDHVPQAHLNTEPALNAFSTILKSSLLQRVQRKEVLLSHLEQGERFLSVCSSIGNSDLFLVINSILPYYAINICTLEDFKVIGTKQQSSLYKLPAMACMESTWKASRSAEKDCWKPPGIEVSKSKMEIQQTLDSNTNDYKHSIESDIRSDLILCCFLLVTNIHLWQTFYTGIVTNCCLPLII